jgi:nucleoside-diphosphate-sugar epimerase
MRRQEKIVITGGAGLVGQNLIIRLKQKGFTQLVAIDKHRANTSALRTIHQDITVIEADVAEAGGWEDSLEGASAVVLGQAQIVGLSYTDFERNNIVASQRVIEVVQRQPKPPHLVLISSSVVNSRAVDFYADTKRAQEQLVRASGLPCTVLRPTLMFGWFDRKHLGWLARFMKRVPVFPVPGNGDYARQPLYVGDFCEVVISCLGGQFAGSVFDISGLEKVTYIEVIRQIKDVVGSRTVIIRVPFRMFWWLLRTYAVFDRHPPFTTSQLEALVIPELFPVIDWPGIFRISATPLRAALEQTFHDSAYSGVVLES